MKTFLKTLSAGLTLAAISTFAVAAHADVHSNPAVQDYEYSTKLDIAKVTQAPMSDFCGVQTVQMSYVDHAGSAHTLRYQVEGDGCLGAS
jgi:hypothetical protein